MWNISSVKTWCTSYQACRKSIKLHKHKPMLYLTIDKPLLQPIHKPILNEPPKYKLIQPQLLIFPIWCLTKIVIWHCSRFLSRTFQVHIYLERHLSPNSPQARQKNNLSTELCFEVIALIWKSNCCYRYHYNRFCGHIIFEWCVIHFT